MMDFEQLKQAPFLGRSHLRFLYFSHHGRINRLRFYLGYLLATVPFWLLSACIPDSAWGIARWVLIPLFMLCLYMIAMLLVKRAHDVNRSGHFCWLLLVPIVSIWPLIELLLFQGTSGDNRFGPDMTASLRS